MLCTVEVCQPVSLLYRWLDQSSWTFKFCSYTETGRSRRYIIYILLIRRFWNLNFFLVSFFDLTPRFRLGFDFANRTFCKTQIETTFLWMIKNVSEILKVLLQNATVQKYIWYILAFLNSIHVFELNVIRRLWIVS